MCFGLFEKDQISILVLKKIGSVLKIKNRIPLRTIFLSILFYNFIDYIFVIKKKSKTESY